MYAINDYFSFTFEPALFSLKPNHSKLCVVQVKSFSNPLHFKRIPAVLEIHYIQDKSTQIAKQLLTEIESIDDPKWTESSFKSHVLLHLDLLVKFPTINRINVQNESDESVASANESDKAKMLQNRPTIFEKLFWEYLSKSKHMRNTSKIPKNLTYQQVLKQQTNTKNINSRESLDKQEILNILSFLTAEACRDIAKNYRFLSPRLSQIF